MVIDLNPVSFLVVDFPSGPGVVIVLLNCNWSHECTGRYWPRRLIPGNFPVGTLLETGKTRGIGVMFSTWGRRIVLVVLKLGPTPAIPVKEPVELADPLLDRAPDRWKGEKGVLGCPLSNASVNLEKSRHTSAGSVDLLPDGDPEVRASSWIGSADADKISGGL